ncbi:ankyrin repeat-containing domain protein [Dendryphion nanum]|uniref:Ankyrin repeat-containing domain protein n=1 Tax=Dendryphion nanum TaxID=256645 RepID=A0A9P9DEG7_9PLEO|nr:ankyrin repeat-containing domain protein [Dendryphion nanum]
MAQPTCDHILSILLEFGAEINSQNDDGRIAMHFAIYTGFESLLRMLLQHGADPNIQDKKGRTPLHVAALEREVKAVCLLSPVTRDSKKILELISLRLEMEDSKGYESPEW